MDMNIEGSIWHGESGSLVSSARQRAQEHRDNGAHAAGVLMSMMACIWVTKVYGRVDMVISEELFRLMFLIQKFQCSRHLRMAWSVCHKPLSVTNKVR